MRFHPLLAFSAIVLGSAIGTLHGCSDDPAQASPGGAAGSSGSGGAAICPPVTCTAPGPTQLTTFADVFGALEAGARVRVILDYSKCLLEGAPGPAAIGGMNIDTFEWFAAKSIGNPKAYFAASETKLVGFPSGFVQDYVRVRVYEDEKVGVEVKYLDPVTFAVSVDEAFTCGISDATTARGATFWRTTP